MRQKLARLGGERDKSIITLREFSTIISIFDRVSTQKIIKKTEDLNVALNQLDLTFIDHSTQQKKNTYIFFSSTPGTFTKIYHILGHK